MNQLSIKDRLLAARRVLFGQGDNAVICSFCGKSRQDGVGNIIAGPGVAICASCSHIASHLNIIEDFSEVEGTLVHVLSIFFDHQACLLPERRSRMHAELLECASELDAKIVGWTYGWAENDFGDVLMVYARVRRDVNLAIFQDTFTEFFLRLMPANETTPRKATLAAPWIRQQL
ncbi:ClpX C4-type zinc finger protein [Agrobacterium sp. BA1120]|uniref:ClpX C4-type zinc finger protein n=1 Tax=Agrobacterium sp. BA1120 TaxID=3228927 RepID=UPI00336A0EEB